MENASRNSCLSVPKDQFNEEITFTWSALQRYRGFCIGSDDQNFFSPHFRTPGQRIVWCMRLSRYWEEESAFSLICEHKLKDCIGCGNANNVEIDILCEFIEGDRENVSQTYKNVKLINHKFSLKKMLEEYTLILQYLCPGYTIDTAYVDLLENFLGKMKIRISITVRSKTNNSCLKIESNNHKLVTTLVNNYESLLTSGKFSDFIIKVNDAELKVHKAVLAARSLFFSAMFENNMSENKLGYHEAKVCEENTFKNLLQFIYCSKVIIHGAGDAMNLLVAADFYELLDLKQVCEIYLLNNINDSNSLDILVFAESYNLTELNIKARDYIVENIQKMSNEVVFDVLSQKAPHSLKEIFKKITRKIK